MPVKTKIVEKLERVEVEIAALPRPIEVPAVAAASKKLATLGEEIEAFKKTKGAQDAATHQAQGELARAMAGGDKSARKAALEALDDSTAALARVEMRSPVFEAARLEVLKEFEQAMGVAVGSCVGEWDQSRKLLDACREQLLAAERAVRQSIGELEQARQVAFTLPARSSGMAQVRFLRRTVAGASIYNTGEIAGFSLKEADRLVKGGVAQFVDEGRALAALELAARA